ncbi:MAG: outer membrane beta-barrel protein [Cyclobacteriaceae bacterium]
MQLLVWLSIFLLLPLGTFAQFSAYGGITASTVSKEYLVGDIQPQMGYHFGLGFQVSDSSIAPFYPGIRLEAVRNGYIQEIESVQHVIRLSYFGIAPYLNYTPLERWSTSLGVFIGGIIQARYRQGAQNIGVTENYRESDIRLQGEIEWQVYEPVNIYLNYAHGLRDLVKYADIDESGNFTGTIRDVKIRAISLGLRVNMAPFLSKL